MKRAGAYYVEVLVDDVMKLRFPVVDQRGAAGTAARRGQGRGHERGGGGLQPPPAAWQPLTFGGVAAFARRAAGAVAGVGIGRGGDGWGVRRSGFSIAPIRPVILQAIQKMPETARVADGQLQGVPRTLVTENRFLAIAVTPRPGGEIGQDVDVQIQLRQSDICAGSVFWPDWGWALDYGKGTAVALGRSNLEPWWSAWEPMLLAGVGAAVALMLLGRVDGSGPGLYGAGPAYRLVWRPPADVGRGLAAGLGGVAARNSGVGSGHNPLWLRGRGSGGIVFFRGSPDNHGLGLPHRGRLQGAAAAFRGVEAQPVYSVRLAMARLASGRH